MNKATLLASLAIFFLAGEASALQEGARRPVLVSGSPAGMITVFYAANIGSASGACLYQVDWESPYAAAGSVMCELAEQKVLYHTSCLANRMSSFGTTVMSTQNKAFPCLGFDQFGLFQQVNLILGESQYSPALNGLGIFQLFPFLPRSVNIT